MSPDEYQKLAERTETDQSEAMKRIIVYGMPAVRLLHSVIGLMGEVGELATAVEKWLWYGQPLDETNVMEEWGDCFWYLAEGHNALAYDMLETMRANIQKLRARYPDKYSGHKAAEENRDLGEEREILERNWQGLVEPQEESKVKDHGLPPESSELTRGEKFFDEQQAERKLTNPSYARICRVCKVTPVHNTSSRQICPNCGADIRAGRKPDPDAESQQG